jgi:hypothetical protein
MFRSSSSSCDAFFCPLYLPGAIAHAPLTIIYAEGQASQHVLDDESTNTIDAQITMCGMREHHMQRASNLLTCYNDHVSRRYGVVKTRNDLDVAYPLLLEE